MARHITEAGRQAIGRGTGEGADYEPYIHPRDFNSRGVCATLKDWITGRSVITLSQGEMYYWHILRFNDFVADIQEQYPLDLSETTRICEELGLAHPRKGEESMTTDFLVTYTDGHKEAHSVKTSRKALESKTTVKNLYIEQMYWELQGVEFKLVFKNELNTILAENIRMCAPYYDISNVHDKYDFVKHCLITKLLSVDLETEPLRISRVYKLLEPEVNYLWQTLPFTREQSWQTKTIPNIGYCM